MSLVSILKEINLIKNNILEMRTNMYLELDNFKKLELENMILESENNLLDLEKKFKLQIILNKNQIQNKNKNQNQNQNQNSKNKTSNESLQKDEILDTTNLNFPDDFTISKQKLIEDYNNLTILKEEKRKYKKLLNSNINKNN
jgi:hypothetical protein